MATVTTPHKPLSRPVAPAAEPLAAVEPDAPDAERPYFGDRIAFVVWITCAMFMAALLTYDTVMGLFR